MEEVLLLFLIIAIGYIIGGIEIGGISLGTSGVLLAALVFGHFQYSVEPIIGQLGLLLFIGSVGFISGPKFVENFKNKAYNYIILGFLVVLIGGILVGAVVMLSDIPISLALGLFSGALTSTPALGSGVDATGGDPLVATGYGIAYIFGVLGVILFVQLIPRFVKQDDEDLLVEDPEDFLIKQSMKRLMHIDPMNMSMFALAMVLGVLLGKIQIPIYKDMRISLGMTGGPLIMGIIFGHIKKIGILSLQIDKVTLSICRELGLILFLTNTGLSSGQNFIEVLSEYGVALFIIGFIMTTVPMMLAYIVGRRVLKLGLYDTLGTITGAMTSTPALGVLLEVSDDNEYVGLAYASTYPVALIFLVILPQILTSIFM